MLILDGNMARIILEMEEVCVSEGMGPNSDSLIRDIFEEFPNLKEEFSLISKYMSM